MKIHLELTKQDLISLALEAMRKTIDVPLSTANVKIEVKSKQNWKAEWEEADFRAVYHEE